jgi:hypothetical protein
MTQSQALPVWLDKLGDWNPQLLRELKGRLSWRSVLLTVALVTIVQVLLMMNYIQQIPTEATITFNNTYCIDRFKEYNSIQTWAKCGGVDWQRWWRDIFNGQNTSILFFIYLPAVYLLISDINQEIQRGTLNFLRLSPRSSQTLLLGKLLGVPALAYLALVLAIPLHLLCGTMAGISPIFFLSYYSTFLVFGTVLLMGALLIGFSQRNTGNKSTSTAVSSSIFLGLLIAGAIVIPLFLVWNNAILWTPYLSSSSDSTRVDWFFLTINRNPIVTHLFTFTNLTIVIVLLWQILQRAFQNPTATLISKRQSYILVPYFVLLIIGFRSINPSTGDSYGGNIVELVEHLVPWIFIGLIFALSTVRQTWFEWIRYRQDSRLEAEGSPRIERSRTDLVLGEKSPGLTAIGLNLVMVAGIIMTALVFSDSSTSSTDSVRNWLGLILVVPLVINYALLVQWMLMLKTQKRSTWAIGSLFFAIGLPSVIGALFTSLGNNSQIGQILLLCSPWYRGMLYTINQGNSGSSDSTNVVTIALSIQAIAILFLSSRVWSEYRKMVRS